ncbi:MAG: polyprenyl synthetase family protein [Chromatiales bacterium]|nr:polyprenyl synthetase family protein [Chromatiales bacterium]
MREARIAEAPAQTSAAERLAAIRALVGEDLAAVDRLIVERLSSDVALINQLGAYIVSAGGKRLRPLLVLLAARACGYRGPDHVLLAAVIEFIHTATLLHDDVVDASELRRGRDTANAMFGNEASVLVGDFLYSRAFEMMVEADDMRILALMSHATNRIAEGEVLQLLNCRDPEIDEARYREVIDRKTATLFSAGAEIGALLAGGELTTALAQYGRHLGIAFQIVDDALDYRGDAAETGKNLGDDLAEGKPTLPLIRALELADANEQRLLREAIEHGRRQDIAAVQRVIEQTGAIDYALAAADAEIALALEPLATLPPTPYRDALFGLAEFSVARSY